MGYLTAPQLERILVMSFRDTRTSETLGDDGWGTVEEYFTDSGGAPIVLSDVRISLEDSVQHANGNWRTPLEMVFKVEVHDRTSIPAMFFRKTGMHHSFEGTTWGGKFEQVQPKREPRTVYESIQS